MNDLAGKSCRDATQRLLVYGLLRKGLSLDGLMRGAVSLGMRHVPNFDLYNLGPYPGAVPGEGVLVTELYQMPANCSWAALDEAEGVSEDPPLYRRVVVNLDDGPAQLYVYARSVGEATKIASGDWMQR